MNFSASQSTQNHKKSNLQHRQTYYSRTQANFFKAYAKQIEFVNRLNSLMSVVQKRKLIKLTEQVKTCNMAFRKYLNERRIVHIKIDDVIAFEQTYERMNMLSTSTLFNESTSSLDDLKRTLLPTVTRESRKKQSRLSYFNINPKLLTSRLSKQEMLPPLEREMIKKGFMTLLQKLQTLKKDEFTNETKYLQSVLLRECHKLKHYRTDLQDQQDKWARTSYNAKTKNIVEEIENEEKVNGIYPLIMKNVRDQTSAIEKAEKTFQFLMNG